MLLTTTIATLENQTGHAGPWHLWVEDGTGAMVLVASADDTYTALDIAADLAAHLAGPRVAITSPDSRVPVMEFGGRVTCGALERDRGC